jgi:hypothetical protein
VTTWSVTPFFNELDVLEIRLATLDAVVDRHVIVEATVTHSEEPKPLVFEENRDRFDRWLHKIDHVVVDDLPGGVDESWGREHAQRDACKRAMDDLDDGDLVFLSDADEIPCPDVFALADPTAGPVWVGMTMHLYFLNWRWREAPVMGGTRASFVTGQMLRETPASVLVESQSRYMDGVHGWHLAYQGGIDAVQRKLAALADFQTGPLATGWQPHWGTRDHLERCGASGADLFDRDYRQLDWVGVEALPPYVQENQERFAHMLCGEPTLVAA